jgi:hypothetical protein
MQARTATSSLHRFRLAIAVIVFGIGTTMSATAFAFDRLAGLWSSAVVGSGKVVQVERVLPAFDRVKVVDGIQVVLRRAPVQKLMLSADDNIAPLVESRVEGSTLLLRVLPKKSMRTRSAIVFTIDYTRLESIALQDGARADVDAISNTAFRASASDGAQLTLAGVTANELTVSVSDGARANLVNVRAAALQRYSVTDGAALSVASANGGELALTVSDGARATLTGLEIKAIDVAVSDGARATLSGSALQQSFKLADAASVDSEKLQGASARLRASDGSTLTLGAVQTIDADVQDGSKLRYTGEPTLTQRLRDGASIKKI